MLVGLMLAAVAFLLVYFSILALLPAAWQTPGSPPLYWLGIIGMALLLVSVVFVGVKRSGHGGAPPALMWLALIGLSVVGVWARTRAASQISATFGTKYKNFGAVYADRRERLRNIIARKTELLSRLAPDASEGTFSLQAVHWCGKPLLAFSYARLVRQENRLIGARAWLDAGIRPTAVFIPLAWGERQPFNPWRSVNFLTDKTQRDPISDQTNLKTLLCRIEKL